MSILGEGGMNVVALVRGKEQYVFLYDSSSRKELLKTLGLFAMDGELSFTWFDVAVLSRKVRELEAEL